MTVDEAIEWCRRAELIGYCHPEDVQEIGVLLRELTQRREAMARIAEIVDTSQDCPVGNHEIAVLTLQDNAAVVPEPPAHNGEVVDLSKCPECGGPADNGHDRCLPPSPYLCSKCEKSKEGREVVYERCDDCGSRCHKVEHTPATDHPELLVEWWECDLCDWHSEQTPVLHDANGNRLYEE